MRQSGPFAFWRPLGRPQQDEDRAMKKLTKRSHRTERMDVYAQRHVMLRDRIRGDDDEILTVEEWCLINKLSPRTGHDILNGPDGPVVIQLSPRRIGVRRGDNRRWQESRARS
jgi:hypothetical protein